MNKKKVLTKHLARLEKGKLKGIGKKILLLACLASVSAISNAYIMGGCVTGGDVWNSNNCKFDVLDTSPLVDKNGGSEVGRNDFNNGWLHSFNEQQGGWSDTYDQSVSSHYVFFDPLRSKTVEGWVKFDGVILDIIMSKNGLKNSEDEFGLDNVTYDYPRLVGLERRDRLGTSGIGTSYLNIDDWKASSPGDHVRVITQTVSEPGTLLLLGIGIAGLGLCRRSMA